MVTAYIALGPAANRLSSLYMLNSASPFNYRLTMSSCRAYDPHVSTSLLESIAGSTAPLVQQSFGTFSSPIELTSRTTIQNFTLETDL